ncbi:MAG: LutC/YkgG family protein [Chitinophagaceae bacterium]
MNVSPTKENVLKKIRQALSNPVPAPFSNSEGSGQFFHASEEDLAVQFANTFSALQGRFVFCSDEKELVQQLGQLIQSRNWQSLVCRELAMQHMLQSNGSHFTFYDRLSDCDASITGCELLVSRTGTIVLSSASESGRTASVYAPVHICIAYTAQLVYDLKDAMEQLRQKYGQQLPSFISFATGPSRTADIEKTLVVGVHGPKEVFVFLVDQPMPDPVS